MTINCKYKVPAIFHVAGTFRIKTHRPTLFLTFDDGPTPEVTPFVLEILKHADIKATFFLSGKNVENHPVIFDEIVKHQHQIGNHGYNHLNGWKTKNQNYFDDIEKATQLIKSNLFRPPYGKLKPSQYVNLKHKYKIIYWHVMSRDFDNSDNSKQSFRKIIQFVNNGSIIVFHDTLKAKNKLVNLLPQVIEFGINNNYQFSKIEI